MAQAHCELKESLEVNARKAVAHEKGWKARFLSRRRERTLLKMSSWRALI